MTCKDTKDIDIVQFLQSNGVETTQKGSYYWCCSPYRNEKTASFSIDPKKNRWADFGTGEKGDLLDLVKLMYKTDTPGALEKLSKHEPDPSFSFLQAKTDPIESVSGIDLKHFQQIQNKALVEYLSSRKISLYIARLYAQEVYYTANNKKYFSIAFKNDKGGFDLRNKYSKLKTSPDCHSTLHFSDSDTLNLFEGWFDFLACLQYFNTTKLKHTTIVLNSLSHLKEVIPVLPRYAKINLFLDNDQKSQSGQRAAEQISKLHPNTVNQAQILYPGFKDFNDFLTGKNPP